MPVYLLNDSFDFPDVEAATKDGLLAVGGDLQPMRVLNAYSNGIFPWYSKEQPILWWSPDPRMVLFPEKLKMSKSLSQVIRSNRFEIRADSCFRQVIEACSNVQRQDQAGTWITMDLIEAFVRLHEMGYAHSFETYHKGRLVGGLYGLSLGGMFFGESMFHYESNASKVALFFLVEFMKKHNFDMIDAQQQTAHLRSLGASILKRTEFIGVVKKSLQKTTLKGNWGNYEI
jgi:leucyl/phenylalanyl-tRNA--protein transferase